MMMNSRVLVVLLALVIGTCIAGGKTKKKVDGKWSSWGAYRSCSKSCGGGVQNRDRKCNNPAPANGGKKCEGEGWESKACNTQACKVNGKWSNWNPYSSCSKPCGGGEKNRDRQCNNPPPSNGGRACSGPQQQKTRCNTQRCPVDGQWSNWGRFSKCSKKCGGGVMKRDRKCNKPKPAYGGRDCNGESWESRNCNEQNCPINGGWTDWGPYSTCSKDCGGGIRMRDRRCTNPNPAHGGKDCKGSAWDKRECNKHKCHFSEVLVPRRK